MPRSRSSNGNSDSRINRRKLQFKPDEEVKRYSYSNLTIPTNPSSKDLYGLALLRNTEQIWLEKIPKAPHWYDVYDESEQKFMQIRPNQGKSTSNLPSFEISSLDGTHICDLTSKTSTCFQSVKITLQKEDSTPLASLQVSKQSITAHIGRWRDRLCFELLNPLEEFPGAEDGCCLALWLERIISKIQGKICKKTRNSPKKEFVFIGSTVFGSIRKASDSALQSTILRDDDRDRFPHGYFFTLDKDDLVEGGNRNLYKLIVVVILLLLHEYCPMDPASDVLI